MPAALSIYKQPHGRHVTTQRPIVISVRENGSSGYGIIHARGVLYIQDAAGNHVNTGVEFNAYSNSANGIFECNVAEYCRQYLVEVKDFYEQNWCQYNDFMYFRRFYVKFHPVALNPNGTLNVIYDEEVDSNYFFTYPLNTFNTESLSTQNDHVRIDYFVNNGSNSSGLAWPSSSWNKPQTNMPDYNCINYDSGVAWYTFPVINRPVNRDMQMKVTNLDTGLSFTVINYAFDNHEGTIPINIHPFIIELWYVLQNGAMANILIDANGEPLCDEFKIECSLHNQSTGAFIRGMPGKIYRICREANCGGKNSTTFFFRNMRGAIDWFVAKGTENKSVAIGGTTFDRHTNFSRSNSDGFGVIKGQHAATNLWNDRTDSFTVFSQPVTKKEAIWLDELVTSPQVWVSKKLDGKYNPSRNGFDYVLQPVIIDKASYKTYSTEDNVNFLEFKYTLSEKTSTMKM